METLNIKDRKSTLIEQSVAALSERGELAAAIKDFSVRREQREMTRAIAQAIAANEDLVVEAGTGIGKTFAYLVPALLSGKRTIVSTATRYLQDQIYFKDLPTVTAALALDCESALLKGRANYLCLEKLARLEQQKVLDAPLQGQIQHIARWAQRSADGDISALDHISEDDPIRPMVTSTVDDCLGKKCAHYSRCYVAAARQKAAQANLVVVNHALLIADLELKEEGFAQLLPEAELIIVDEAHQLKSVAEQNFTESFSSYAFGELIKEISKLLGETPKDSEAAHAQLDVCLHSFKLFADILQVLEERAPIGDLQSQPSFDERYNAFAKESRALFALLKPYRGLSEQWGNSVARLKTMLAFINGVLAKSDDGKAPRVKGIAWFQRRKRSFQIYLSPVDVAKLLAEKIEPCKARWIYTSATLSVKGDFSYFLSGDANSTDKKCQSYDSPYDYRAQAALYVPSKMPHPKDDDHIAKLLVAIEPILAMANGRSFLLFTSYKAMHKAEELLANENRYTLYVQQQAPKMELLARFINTPQSLLLGTSSFWHGVDVRGDALRCVVIDKLPFASFSDPLSQARRAFYEQEGRDFFNEYSLPEAVIVLRQGVGRLIRSEYDSGVVVIGDRRFYHSKYGHIFRASLPPMKRCDSVDALAAFLK